MTTTAGVTNTREDREGSGGKSRQDAKDLGVIGEEKEDRSL